MGRNDVVLMVGLTVALFVIFSGPVSRFLDYVTRDRGSARPASPACAPSFWRRSSASISFASGRKCATRHRASRAPRRKPLSAHLKCPGSWRLGMRWPDRLDSESSESIRDVAAAQIPLLAPGRGAWVMTRTRSGHWESLMAVGESSPSERERAARRALGESEPLVGSRAGRNLFSDDRRGHPGRCAGRCRRTTADRSSAQRSECGSRTAGRVAEELSVVPRGPRKQRERCV